MDEMTGLFSFPFSFLLYLQVVLKNTVDTSYTGTGLMQGSVAAMLLQHLYVPYNIQICFSVAFTSLSSKGSEEWQQNHHMWLTSFVV